MAQLSDEELREAAREAGISPHELRHALAQREGTALEKPSEAGSLMGTSARGDVTTYVEGRIERPPADALAAVRASVERQTGRSGHRQGDSEADVVDDSLGINYRMRTTDDGSGGALVRVDVDDTSGRTFRNLFATGVVGTTVLLLGLAMLIGSTFIGLSGAAVGVLGTLAVLRRTARLARGVTSARAIASQALMDAEDSASPQGMLPPAR